jgi:Helix-turn-helix domain
MSTERLLAVGWCGLFGMANSQSKCNTRPVSWTAWGGWITYMKTYQHLSDDERYQIAAMRLRKFGLRAISRELGRSPSTISREIQRNAYTTDGRYKAYHACNMARSRRRRARQGTT